MIYWGGVLESRNAKVQMRNIKVRIDINKNK
jgi:hypothetical protein